MSTRNAELLLAAVIVARSTSYVINKIAVGCFSVFNLMALRFVIGAVILVCIFRKRFAGLRLRTVLRGWVLGTFFFAVSALETTGLKTVSPSVDAFLVNSSVILVPLMRAVIVKRAPEKSSLLAGCIAMVGVAFLTVLSGSFTLGSGAMFCFAAAILYSGAIILTDRFSHEDDGLMLGVLQVCFIAVYALIFSFVTGAPRLPAGTNEWLMILTLAVVCTVFGFTLQPVAQSRTSAERAGLFCAINPLSAAVLDCVFLSGAPSGTDLIGFALILFSIFMPFLFRKKAPAAA